MLIEVSKEMQMQCDERWQIAFVGQLRIYLVCAKVGHHQVRAFRCGMKKWRQSLKLIKRYRNFHKCRNNSSLEEYKIVKRKAKREIYEVRSKVYEEAYKKLDTREEKGIYIGWHVLESKSLGIYVPLNVLKVKIIEFDEKRVETILIIFFTLAICKTSLIMLFLLSK